MIQVPLGLVGDVACMSFKIIVLGRTACEQKLSKFEEWLEFLTCSGLSVSLVCVLAVAYA